MKKKILLGSICLLICLICIESGIAEIKSIEGNGSGTGLYTVTGETTRTNFLIKSGILINNFHQKVRRGLFIISGLILNRIFWDIDLGNHRDSWITFGVLNRDWEGNINYWYPSEGYINIVTPEGKEIEINGTFYGRIKIFTPFQPYPDNIRDYYVGIIGFKGTRDGNYFSGTAEQVDIEIEK